MGATQSPSKPPLTPFKRVRTQSLVNSGLTYAKIAKKMNCSVSTVAYTMKRWKQHGSHYNRPRSGRRLKLSDRDRRSVVRYAASKKWKTWRQISDMLKVRGISISQYTVRNIAHASGLRRFIARERPALTKVAQKTRVLWARANGDTDWNRIVFTDECSLDSSDLKRKPWVTRAAGTATLPQHTSHSFRGNRKLVMVWGAVADGRKSSLVRLSGTGQPEVDSARYIETVMSSALPTFVLDCELETHMLYEVVEDNALVHNSRATVAAREETGLSWHPHPPLSPDLNPIEKVWRLLKSRLRARNLRQATPDQLWAAIQEKWDLTTPNDFNKYIEAMPSRVRTVKKRQGRFTE